MSLPKIERLLRAATRNGSLARGALETVRAIERRRARLVFVAADVERDALRETIQRACAERLVPCVEGPPRSELGAWSGLERPAAAVALTGVADAEAFLEAIDHGAHALTRSLEGLQAVLSGVPGRSDREALVLRARGALDALGAGHGDEANERTLAELLRCTVLLAVDAKADLQRAVDGWTLARWLEEP